MHSLINIYSQIDACEKCRNLGFLKLVNGKLEKRTINSFLKEYDYRIPERVKFLFVAESTPERKDTKMYSFYNIDHPPGSLKQYIFKWLSILDEEFWKTFEKHGYQSIETMNCFLKNCFLTDAIKCVTLGDKKNRGNYEKATSRCLDHLEAEVKLLSPKFVIALGKTAWYGVANVVNRLCGSYILNPEVALREALPKTVTNGKSIIRIVGLRFPFGKQ